MYPDLPKPGKRRSYMLRFGDKLPWSGRAAEAVNDDHKFFVYFGLVEKKVLEAELVNLFQVEAETGSYSGNHVRDVQGKTFLCAIEVGADGQPLASTLQLAAFAAAFAERKNGKRIAYSLLLDALKDKLQDVQSAEEGVADGGWFRQVIDFIVAELDWEPRELMAREQICVHQVTLIGKNGKRLSRVPEMEPVNSFYLTDLERMLAQAERGEESSQIGIYLCGHEDTAPRTDVTSLDVIDNLLKAPLFPAGRWPSRFPLFLMQQLAVNTGLSTLADGGIFSVNGPPGTGKTTLLMDVIAARIVERATLLAQFDQPANAFSRRAETITYPANAAGSAASGPCFSVAPALLDCGIVVASANNKAVENITLDLPSLDKVFPQPLSLDGAPFDYFSAAAESILNPEKSPPDLLSELEEPEEEHELLKCWGLISVPLGNKTNRNLVAKRLGKFGEFGLARELDGIAASALDWSAAKATFQSCVDRVSAIQQQIAAYEEAWPALRAALEQADAAQAAASAAGLRHGEAEAAFGALERSGQDIDSELQGNLRERELHTQEWPWWRALFARLFRPAEFERCRERERELSDEYDRLRAGRAQARRERASAAIALDAAAAELQTAQAAASAKEVEAGRVRAQLAGLAGTLGPAAFDPLEFARMTLEQQQMSLPRSNVAYHEARAAVFVAAMHLHKAFLKAAGKPFETNFRLALAMLEQQAYLQPMLPELAPHLWATFFLAVPVVSSTFASFSRCYADLGQGQIGLLLVDEAGQAVPSHALGAIWRSKRALIVGDPLQVEPVIKMDRKLDYSMLQYHAAPPEHQLTRYSAQHLADRANRYGAHVMQFDGADLWVGAPLRVHRRCVEPMFGISNEIAYNGTMVLGLDARQEAETSLIRPLLGQSCWRDLRTERFDEHFSAVEGQAALDIVCEYSRQDWTDGKHGMPDLFLITPFKSVAVGLSAMLRDCAELWAAGASDDTLATWLQGHVGTVHTFQGKESESVVLVLGGATAGARNWAGSRPNLINVAVTRAKRRLYVIGDRRAWSATTFGAKLSAALP
ncbi:MAG: AAA domain-containing protein [Pseudomonadota bacterium]